jgi:hypothetical protein
MTWWTIRGALAIGQICSDMQAGCQIRKLRLEVLSQSEVRPAVLNCGDSLCARVISCGEQCYLARTRVTFLSSMLHPFVVIRGEVSVDWGDVSGRCRRPSQPAFTSTA